MQAPRERRHSSYSFLIPTLDGVSGQRHTPAAIYPREMTPETHCTGGWVGPRAGLDTEARGKILWLCWVSNSDRLLCSQTLYWATPAPSYFLLGSVYWLLMLPDDNKVMRDAYYKVDCSVLSLSFVDEWKEVACHCRNHKRGEWRLLQPLALVLQVSST
jgi:hypothetical protein